MEIYERIKRRRKEIGLSADEVAEALNVSRATVFRYESKEIEKIPIHLLVPLAKVLKCTPSYLMGWEEAPTTDHEKELLSDYRTLSDDAKAQVDRLIAYAKAFETKEGLPK